MDSQRVRIGVVGLGRIGWSFHCKSLAKREDFVLVAVADTDAERRREAEESMGCRAYAESDRMVASEGLDAVVIATPTHLHESMVMKAFDAGLHVLLEKPMAPTYEEAARMVETAERTGRVFTVYQPHRHHAYFQHLRAILATGKIGEVYWVQRGAFSYARRNDWQSLREFGGGMLNNYGAHYLDQVLQLIGYDIRRVFCNLQLVASLGDADDVVKIVVETERGAIGECTINQASVAKPYEFIIWGKHGTLSYTDNTFHIVSFDPESLPDKQLNKSLTSADRKYPHDKPELTRETIPVDPAFQVDVFADFASAIRKDTPPAVPPRQTLALMELLRRCRENSAGIRVMG